MSDTPASTPPLQMLREAEVEFVVAIAELHGILAAVDAATTKLRRARAALDAAALPRVASEEAWREFCDRVYTEMMAGRPDFGPRG